MEIGNEIGQKIRSAIKAKLVELGAYVDDELPDYIMVMVANRKTEQQMAEDLSLFLGNNTSKFTTWLHNLLEKLQSITSTGSESAEGRSKPAVPSSQSAPVLTEESASAQPVAAAVAVKQANTGQPKPETDSDVLAARATLSRTKLDEEPVIKLAPEHDEFEDEGVPEKSVAKPAHAKSDISTAGETSTVKEPRKESRKISLSALESRKRTREEEEYIPQPVSTGHLAAKKRLGAVTQRSTVAKYAKTTSETSGGRRALGSTVGAVLQHDDDDEEEYDPRRPAIGNVASVVKVTERRSSVPVTLQANKSLLMKAMQQAEQSVAKARQHLFTTKPASVASAAKADESDRLVMKPQQDTPRPEHVPTLRTSNQSMLTETKLASTITSQSSRAATQQTSSQLTRTSDIAPALVRRSPVEPEPGPSGVLAARMMTEESVDMMEQEDDSLDSEEDGLRQLLLLQQTNMKPVGQRASSPKFVVTLDGASESLTAMDTVDADAGDTGDTLLERSSASARNVVRVKPQTQQALATFEQDDDAQAAGNDLAAKLHANERCKFWPACKNGDTCQYHHPTQPCKTFPACRFGGACLFIHPNCRFDASCRNTQCPYTHSCPRRLTTPSPTVPVIVQPVRMPVYVPRVPRFPAPRPMAPKQTRCKFFPHCTDMNCTFLHPKPCRYGLSCTSRQTSCPFSHPDFPDKQKMKWTAPKAGPSGSS